MADPILLPSNRPPERFYRGGRRITDFRGDSPALEREPEDWVASTTTLNGETSLGLSTLPDGRTLLEAITQAPVEWLGADHLARFGADPRLLVKLLDAGQRLPVHAHPDGAFAHQHLGRAHGKTEAWYVLSGGEVHLGLQRDVAPDELAELVASQNTAGLLALLHRVPVKTGDVVLVPAGMLHAIGAGVFLIELQEPEDLSIVLEWKDFAIDGARHGHLGLGFGIALGAVELRARSPREIARLARPAGFGPSVLPVEADPFFRLERISVRGAVTIGAGFAVVIVADGSLTHGSLSLPRGSTLVVPHSAGPLVLSGDGEVVVCRPPAP
ncbi:MAG: class I mannose-6-phosphate isomerase [Rhodoglobus sp.]